MGIGYLTKNGITFREGGRYILRIICKEKHQHGADIRNKCKTWSQCDLRFQSSLCHLLAKKIVQFTLLRYLSSSYITQKIGITVSVFSVLLRKQKSDNECKRCTKTYKELNTHLLYKVLHKYKLSSSIQTHLHTRRQNPSYMDLNFPPGLIS